MAYTLSAVQQAALNSDLTNLQNTLDGYDSEAFIAATNSGVVTAQETDNAFQSVIVSFDTSVDGAAPREVEVLQLNGTTIQDPLFGSLTSSNYDELVEMGQIGPLVDKIIAIEPKTLIENSEGIRFSINRFYPDADDKETRFTTDTTSVFEGPTFYALQEGTRTNTNRQNTTSIPLLLSVMFTSGGSTFGVNDFEQFILYFADTFLPSPGGSNLSFNGTTAGVSNTNATLRTVNVGGTARVTISTSGSGSGDAPTPTDISVGSIINLNGIPVQAVNIISSSVMTSPGDMGPPAIAGSATRTVDFEYLYLQVGTIPSSGFTVTNGSGFNAASLITAVTALKRFPALSTQALIAARILVILGELGTRGATGIYPMRYESVNARANWNDGSLALLEAKRNGRLNLFNPQQLIDQGLIPASELTTFVNEYTRTRDKIAYITAVLAGSS